MASRKSEEKKKKNTGKRWGWWAFAIFFPIMALHGLGILFFTQGFLLTRSELSTYSRCSDASQSPCNVTAREGGCWTKPAVDRIVIVVFDALRFDFLAPSTFFEDKKPWMDKLQVVHKLATQRGSSARIFKAIADPPTTSLQRLKGLTTGGLPTFIDVGNSFGAPAIVEDNLIYQLVQSGKRVTMMGDDTWVQLFPDHFNSSYPFPSFNVKDLHTVDNGCIEHLLPSLYKEDWDVLIAHFLGVDHAGHISGVDSAPMIEKLVQYNGILENVVEVLDSQSGPGGLHQNTLLLVMGDHGQTLNGDHGGGSAEEVETAVFALSLKKPLSCLSSEMDTSSCQIDAEGKKLCISSFQQLDFAVTVSALLGIPFPFGSLGRVNPELYALATSECQNQSGEDWMQSYANILCINSWQVKRYIDVYSASSLIGFSDNDMMHISDLYSKAKEISSHPGKVMDSSLPKIKLHVDAYSNFLANVAEIARSKWTEFNMQLMGIGFSIMLASIFFNIMIIKRLDKLSGLHFSSSSDTRISFGVIFASLLVLIRSSSVLSNSYILEEGKVGSFLLATIGMLQLRYAILKKKMRLEALVFVLLVPILRFGIELGQSKQAINSLFLKASHSWMLGIFGESYIWKYAVDIFAILALIILAYILCKSIACRRSLGILKYIIPGTVLSYLLIAVFWALDSNILNLHMVLGGMEGNLIPQIVYAIGLVQFSLLGICLLSGKEKTRDLEENIMGKALAMLSSWSPTVILLSGKQGALVALASIIGGWCIIRLMRLEQEMEDGCNKLSAMYASPTIQWSLLSVCLFFCTGHWCAFDGLRYAAAFLGFDEFNIVRQAILLTIETFGFSYILPILGLPFLIARQKRTAQALEKGSRLPSLLLCQVYLIYGLIKAIEVTFTILCVTIHRRHLMVWGLFAPKFVFDVAGLVLSDFFICLASLYYIL